MIISIEELKKMNETELVELFNNFNSLQINNKTIKVINGEKPLVFIVNGTECKHKHKFSDLEAIQFFLMSYEEAAEKYGCEFNETGIYF